MKKMYKLAVALCSFVLLTACGGSSNEGVENQVQEQPSEVEEKETDKVAEMATTWDYFLFNEDVAIHAEIKDDKVVLTFNENAFQNFYGFENLCYTSSTPIEVENLKGAPQSLFIGDIGNDYNPILCVLLENGDLQILGLFDCVRYCDSKASEVLFHDVEYLEDGPGGCYESEDGGIICDYVTIYVYSNNEKHEMML